MRERKKRDTHREKETPTETQRQRGRESKVLIHSHIPFIFFLTAEFEASMNTKFLFMNNMHDYATQRLK